MKHFLIVLFLLSVIFVGYRIKKRADFAKEYFLSDETLCYNLSLKYKNPDLFFKDKNETIYITAIKTLFSKEKFLNELNRLTLIFYYKGE